MGRSKKSKQTERMTLCFSRYAIARGIGTCPNYYYPSEKYEFDRKCEADIICVDDNLHVYEIEVKRSLHDLGQEQFKSTKINQLLKGEYFVNYFSYLIPESIYEKAAPKIHCLFGIYTINDKNGKNNTITRRRKPRKLKISISDGFVYASILKQATKNMWRYYEKSYKL